MIWPYFNWRLLRAENGGLAGGLLGLLCLISVAIGLVLYVFGAVVPPGMIGVRQVSFGPFRGFSLESLNPGYHWNLPLYSTIHFIPRDFQVYHFSRGPEHGPKSQDAIEVQTTDGARVLVDFSVLVRFYPAAEFKGDGSKLHGGPVDLLREAGAAPDKWREKIVPVIVNEIKRSLARLSTVDFYDPKKREGQIEEADAAIDVDLAPFGAHSDGVLLRRYTYVEERIDNAIFLKNLQDQEERLNQAASRLAQAQASLEGTVAELDARIATLRTQGLNSAKVIRSQGDLYEAEKKAQGDLLVASAQAEIDQQRAELLSSSEGSEVFVAKEIAPILGALKGGVVTNIDPFDLQAWMKRFGMNSAR